MLTEERGTNGIRTYGSVELNLFPAYGLGDVIQVAGRIYMQVVDRVEDADGIVVLATTAREGHARPACTCVLFTHYKRHAFMDVVDHAATVTHLALPTDTMRMMTEIAFTRDLTRRSLAAALTYHPRVRYL